MCARAAPAAAQADTGVKAVLNDSGIVVRFPRAMSPDSITREMMVGDLFSGYEWRIVLMGPGQALLTALVLAPNDSLVLHHYSSIRDLYMAGDLRQCRRNDEVLECDRLARGLVRDAHGCIEVAIADSRWITMALAESDPVIRLVVKRNRQIVWRDDVPLVVNFPGTSQ